MGFFDKAKKAISDNLQDSHQMFGSIVEKFGDSTKLRQEHESANDSLQAQYNKVLKENEQLKDQLSAARKEIEELKALINKKEASTPKLKQTSKTERPAGNTAGNTVTPNYIEGLTQDLCNQLKSYGKSETDQVISSLEEIVQKIEKKYKDAVSRIEDLASGLDEISEKKADSLKAKVKAIESSTLNEIKSMDNGNSLIKAAYDKIEKRKDEIINRLDAIVQVGLNYLEELESRDLSASYDKYDISSARDDAEREIGYALDDAVDTLNDLDKNIYYQHNVDIDSAISDAELELDSAVSSAESDIEFAIE